MGAFYGNITLKGPSQQQVSEALRGRRAIVAPKLGGYTVAFDSVCDEQDIDGMQAWSVVFDVVPILLFFGCAMCRRRGIDEPRGISGQATCQDLTVMSILPQPNQSPKPTRPSHHCCNRGVPRAGSLSLGR